MARPKGLEPLTYGSGGRRSIQLSYGRATPQVYIQSFTSSIRQCVAAGLIQELPAVPTPATSSAITATTTTNALCFGPCFVHVQRPSGKLSAIKRRNRLLSFFGVRHLDEPKAT